jgi:hypothetical protein
MKKMQEKSKTYKEKHKLPRKPSHMDGDIKFQPQKGSNQDTRFFNAKDNTP